ncbi:MAG: SGNH/GDSL hydrolase family protein [Candidatus Cyclobacteriaceae bacterium M2_1C_046]
MPNTLDPRPIILILTDSVALPRKFNNEQVNWEETYIYKLQKNLPQYEVVSLSIGGASIVDILSQIKYYEILKAEIVILQCGIVDAAPRAFGKIEMALLKKLKLMRFSKPLVNFLRRYRQHHYVSPTLFTKSLKIIKTRLNTAKFYAIGILPISKAYDKKAPGIKKSVEIYNNILKNESQYIDMEAIPENGILDDHHHINSVGQNFIYEKIREVIKFH